MQRKTTRTLGGTLRPISAAYRAKVRRIYRGGTPLNDERRSQLAEAIGVVERELEDRQPKHPQVALLRAVRNVLLDDLGENEPQPGLRWPHVEAVAEVIRRKGAPRGCSEAFRRQPHSSTH